MRLPRQFGAYELIEEIGRGGAGIVFKARQPVLHRMCAMKMLLIGRTLGGEYRFALGGGTQRGTSPRILPGLNPLCDLRARWCCRRLVRGRRTVADAHWCASRPGGLGLFLRRQPVAGDRRTRSARVCLEASGRGTVLRTSRGSFPGAKRAVPAREKRIPDIRRRSHRAIVGDGTAFPAAAVHESAPGRPGHHHPAERARHWSMESPVGLCQATLFTRDNRYYFAATGLDGVVHVFDTQSGRRVQPLTSRTTG